MLLTDLKRADIIRHPNYYKIPVTPFRMNEEGISAFNEIYFQLKEHCKTFHTIKRTKSGGISVDHIKLPAWDIRELKSCVEITVLSIIGMFRVQLRTKGADDKAISGSKCFTIFRGICKQFGVDLEDLAIEDGEQYKESIPKTPIDFYRPTVQYKIYQHCYHIDLNSSFMSGIADAFPELRAPIEHIYYKRKERPIYKDILTHTQGFMQSKIVNYRWAHVSKAGIESNNFKIDDLTKRLLQNGFMPLLFNTDGIWYTSSDGRQYHDENEGSELGLWKTDHFDCTFQAVSKGAYHFIENGKCTTVLRGHTRLDSVKKRDQWQWEDLFDTNAEHIAKVYFSRDRGAWLEYD